ncbi:ketopantoate reductase family protein [Leucobacter soli]|uniref:2-dehydropantoate 2-reductase n=1 Tax=Leucobacter soli TaxID=2812850 RepID=A0A916JSX1_9MICO|nr:ketopantoate reductase family protein [Leucobacter soli]CAG7600664.1 2-dehydropantoate 2-reductase [Leucobacter soli]
MRILIVGAGAVGGYFGACLAQAGAEVTFLVRPARAASLAITGLVLVDLDCERTTVPVTTVTADRLDDGWDVVLLAVKATGLASALVDLEPAIGAQTVILPILNGIDHISSLCERFGAQHVLGGVAVVATELGSDGEIVQVAPGASIAFGELDGTTSDRTTCLLDVLAKAGLEAAVSESIMRDVWEKWLFMAAGGAASVLLGGTVGAIVATTDGADVVRLLIKEVVGVQRAEGYPPRDDALDRVLKVLTQPGSSFTTSLYRDFKAGRPTEVEPILGSLVHRAVIRRIGTPLLRAATIRLRVHENSLSGSP